MSRAPVIGLPAQWAGDSDFLPTGHGVEILAWDVGEPDRFSHVNATCWVRYRRADEGAFYHSCDLRDLEISDTVRETILRPPVHSR